MHFCHHSYYLHKYHNSGKWNLFTLPFMYRRTYVHVSEKKNQNNQQLRQNENISNFVQPRLMEIVLHPSKGASHCLGPLWQSGICPGSTSDSGNSIPPWLPLYPTSASSNLSSFSSQLPLSYQFNPPHHQGEALLEAWSAFPGISTVQFRFPTNYGRQYFWKTLLEALGTQALLF